MGEDCNAATVDVAPDGDIVLVVGPTEKRIRVHSLFLKTASPVMNAMLGPYFKEGQQLGGHGLAEVEFPKDDADAMEIVCNVIHGRNHMVAHTLSARDMMQVAIVTDKYDCSVALTFAIQGWLKCASVATDPEQLWALAMAASMFGDSETFKTTTTTLIFHYAESYLDLAETHLNQLDSILPLKTATMLEESRNRLRMGLLMEVLNGDWHCGANRKARHRPDWLTHFMQRTSNFENRSLDSVLEALHPISKLDDDEDPMAYSYLSSPGNDSHRFFGYLSANFRRKHGKSSGLCLLCVRRGDGHDKHAEPQ